MKLIDSMRRWAPRKTAHDEDFQQRLSRASSALHLAYQCDTAGMTRCINELRDERAAASVSRPHDHPVAIRNGPERIVAVRPRSHWRRHHRTTKALYVVSLVSLVGLAAQEPLSLLVPAAVALGAVIGASFWRQRATADSRVVRAATIAGVMLGLVVASTVGGGDGGMKDQTAKAVAAAQAGLYDQAWHQLQLQPVARDVQSGQRCAQYSSGQVRQLFTRTPCRSLKRALLVVGTDKDTIAISVSWVQMPNASSAASLKQTLDKDGTGDISPIPGQVLALENTHFVGKHYSSRRSGAMVVIAEAEGVRGHPAADLLDAVAQVAVELPPQ